MIFQTIEFLTTGGVRFGTASQSELWRRKTQKDLKVRARPVYRFLLQPTVVGHSWA